MAIHQRKTTKEEDTKEEDNKENNAERRHHRMTTMSSHQDFKHSVGGDDQGTRWQVAVLLGQIVLGGAEVGKHISTATS